MPLDRVLFLNAGHCSQWGYLAGGPFWSLARFHAVFVYLSHPQHGAALIDTGYSEHFFSATRRFPGRLYRWATPARLGPHRDACGTLQAQGVAPSAIRRVFVSHFHGDHVAGLKLFPHAAFVYRRASHEEHSRQRPFTQVRHGFLTDLLPDEFVARGEPIEESAFVTGSPPLHEFLTFDFWGDGSVVLVDLPGHGPGHTGYLLTTASERLFYIVDATWNLDVMMQGRQLPWPSRRIQHCYRDYVATQDRLRRLAQAGGPPLIACHCPRTQPRIAPETP